MAAPATPSHITKHTPLIGENLNSSFLDSKEGKITAIVGLLFASLIVPIAPVTLYFAYQIWTGLDADQGIGAIDPTTFDDENRLIAYNALTENQAMNTKASFVPLREDLDWDRDVFPALADAVRNRKRFVFIPIQIESKVALFTVDLHGQSLNSDYPEGLSRESRERMSSLRTRFMERLMDNYEWGKIALPNAASLFQEISQGTITEGDAMTRSYALSGNELVPNDATYLGASADKKSVLEKAITIKGSEINPFKTGFRGGIQNSEQVYLDVKLALSL